MFFLLSDVSMILTGGYYSQLSFCSKLIEIGKHGLITFFCFNWKLIDGNNQVYRRLNKEQMPNLPLISNEISKGHSSLQEIAS